MSCNRLRNTVDWKPVATVPFCFLLFFICSHFYAIINWKLGKSDASIILLRIWAIKELQQTQGHAIHLFVVDGWVHDDGVDVSRGSSKRRSRRVATAVARGAATATTATTVAVTILGAGSEETLHSTGRHRRSFSLKKTNKTKTQFGVWKLEKTNKNQFIWFRVEI